ncbi:GerAB/ArcD/ProY family transporter [Cohnella soli]|uniref:GerAB/ArcD/ProY family transporter n=1 Tax=Cohnella soli TaxID=425005 RepID=A0ABW0I2P6_9BACL
MNTPRALSATGFYSDFLLIAFLVPYLTERNKGMKWGMYAVHLVVPTFIMFDFVPYLLFSDITGSLSYPMIGAIRYIIIGQLFEHLEAIVMSIYVGGVFIKISVFFYVVALGTAQWLKLSDYRPIVMPVGFLLVLFSIWSAASLQELAGFFMKTTPFYALTLQTVVPVLLLMIALIRKKPEQS